MSATTPRWNQVVFTYRSQGLPGLLRGAARKAFHPLGSVETFVVMRAPLPRPQARPVDGVTCERLSGNRRLRLREPTWPDADAILRRWEERDLHARLTLSVALEGDSLVGVCTWERDVVGLPGFSIRAPVPSYFVHFVGVRENSRGRGIAAALLALSDDEAARDGACWRLALVSRHNRASLNAFVKSGAQAAGLVRVVSVLGASWFAIPAWLREPQPVQAPSAAGKEG